MLKRTAVRALLSETGVSGICVGQLIEALQYGQSGVRMTHICWELGSQVNGTAMSVADLVCDSSMPRLFLSSCNSECQVKQWVRTCQLI